MKSLQLSVIIVTLLLLGTGCASIVSKSDWPVTFNSNPSGSDLVVRDHVGKEIHRGTTPATVTLHASKGYMQPAVYEYEVSSEGYHPAKGSVTAGINGWYFGNIAFGGLIGILIVDPLTGAAFKLPPDAQVDLIPVRTTDAGKRSLTIVKLNDVPLQLRESLIPLR